MTMETFIERQQSHRLELLRNSVSGTMYLQYDARTVPQFVIRHLDGRILPGLGERVAQLAHAMHGWLSEHRLGDLVVVDFPVEVQGDFVVWPFHLDFDPIRLWDASNLATDLPSLPELPEMRIAVEARLSEDINPNATIHGALRRSLLDASGSTYFDADMNRFVVVEPVVDVEELVAWAP